MPNFIGTFATAARATSTGLMDEGRVNSQVRRLAHDIFTGDAAQDDTVTLAVLDWDTLLDPALSIVEFDDFGTSITLDIGDVTDPDALCAGLDIATAAGTANPLRTLTIAKRRQPLWQALGYATIAAARLIGPRCTLSATFKGGSPASGSLGWSLYGSPQ